MAGFVKLLNHKSFDHESRIIRFSNGLDSPISRLFGLETPSAFFFLAIQQYGEKRCLAFRKIVAHVLETKLLGDWQYYTYAEVGQRVREMGAGLKKLLGGKKVQRLHMAAANSATWFMLSHAASMASIELICVNPKIGQRELTHTLTNVPATAVFTDSAFISRLLTPLVECPHVRLIIYNTSSEVDTDLDTIDREVKSLTIGLGGRTKIISIGELCKIGLEVLDNVGLDRPTDKEKTWGHLYARTLNEYELPAPDTVTNAQVTAGVAGMHYALKPSLFKGDTYLSYLPLYIRLEYNLVNALFVSGITIGFGTDIDTYLLSAPYNSKLCPVSYGDIQSFQPSILFGIRPWWDMIHGKVLQVVADRPAIEQKEFWYYLEKKREVVAGMFPRLASLSYLFEKWGHIQEIRNGFFGERIRWIGVTCSMMTAEKRELLGLVFGGPKGIMVEGWPLPHLNADITFMPPQHHTRNGLGRPLPCIEIKLVASTHDGFSESRNIYRGHIHIRGPSLPKPPGTGLDLTSNSSSSDNDEWVSTGRIGEWHASQQSLRVIDNLIEPLTARYLGDYIPIEKLEATYKKVDYVRECVLLHTWKCVQLIGIINIDDTVLPKFVSMNLDDHCLRQEVVRDLQKHGIKEGLVEFELVAGIIMAFEPWDKKLRMVDGTVDREKVVVKYKSGTEELARML